MTTLMQYMPSFITAPLTAVTLLLTFQGYTPALRKIFSFVSASLTRPVIRANGEQTYMPSAIPLRHRRHSLRSRVNARSRSDGSLYSGLTLRVTVFTGLRAPARMSSWQTYPQATVFTLTMSLTRRQRINTRFALLPVMLRALFQTK